MNKVFDHARRDIPLELQGLITEFWNVTKKIHIIVTSQNPSVGAFVEPYAGSRHSHYFRSSIMRIRGRESRWNSGFEGCMAVSDNDEPGGTIDPKGRCVGC